LANQALVELPENFIQREAAHAILDGMRDYYAKQNLFIGGERSLNEALKTEAVKAAVGPPAELRRTGQPIMLAVWKCRSPQ
jgi:hypothetical protein